MTKSQRLFKSMLFLLITMPIYCSAGAYNGGGSSLLDLTMQYPIHWVSIEQISEKLKSEPAMSVGFDVDDTILFSSSVFFYGKQKYSPGSNDYLNNAEFWNEVNKKALDTFSLPKKSAEELILLHLKRNDKIFFITARPFPENGKEHLTSILQNLFNIPKNKMNPVIFTGMGEGAKVEYIRKNGIKIYYGDSDSDLRDAIDGGAEGIRVLRPLNSTNTPPPKNGGMGEKVIINSWY